MKEIKLTKARVPKGYIRILGRGSQWDSHKIRVDGMIRIDKLADLTDILEGVQLTQKHNDNT